MTERESGIPRSQLDKATRERIERLVANGANGLTEGDKAFLTARRDYLSAAERKDLGITGKTANTDEGGDKYDGMNADELKAELKKRELPVGGKVAELRERLRENDAE